MQTPKPLADKDKARLQRMLQKIDKKFVKDNTLQVVHILSKVADARTPLILRLKFPNKQFRSLLMVNDKFALILKPASIAPYIKKGSEILLEYTDLEDMDTENNHYLLVLKVLQEEVKVNESWKGMICEIPRDFVHQEYFKRLGKRYDVSNRMDCILTFPKRETPFKILDFSKTGIRYEIPATMTKSFNVDDMFRHVKLDLMGQKIDILFMKIRNIQPTTVSCRVGYNSENFKKIETLITTLETNPDEAGMDQGYSAIPSL